MFYRFNELNQVEQLIHQGSLSEAFNRVKELKKQSNLSEEDQFECQLVTIDALIQFGNINEALSRLEQFLGLEASIRLSSHALGLKSEALFRLGKHDESIAVTVQLERKLEKLTNVPKIENYYVIYLKGVCFLAKSANYSYTGDLDRALDFAQQSKEMLSQIGAKFRLAQIENVLGNIYATKGDFSQALINYQHSLAISREYGFKYYIFATSNNIADIFRLKGDLIQALNHHQSQLAQLDESDSDIYLPIVLESIGHVHCQRGDLDQALEYLQKSHDLYKESQYKASFLPLASSARGIGRVYYQRGDLDQALKYYQESLTLQQELGNLYNIAPTLLDLIVITIDHHSLELTNQYLAQLREINTQMNNKLINQQFRFAQALILKTKPRMTYHAKAQAIFQQLMSEDIIDNELAIIIRINLCELLLDELKTYNEDEIFQEAKDLVQQLQVLAETQHLFPLIIDIFILQSKFALIEGDLTQAAKILDQAENLAHEKSLGLLEGKVIQEQQLLKDQHRTWQDLITSNASFHERLNQANLRDYIKLALQLKSGER